MLNPLAAATAAPAQSLSRSAGSMSLRRDVVDVAAAIRSPGPPGTRRSDPWWRRRGWRPRRSSRWCAWCFRPSSPRLGRRRCRRRPPTAGCGGRCRACRRPVHIAQLRTIQHARVVGDVAGQPERWCAACGGRQQDPGGQDREDQAEQAGDAHDRQCSAIAGPGHPVPAKTPGRLCVGGDQTETTHTTSSTGSGWWSSRRRVPCCRVPTPNIAPISPGTGPGCCTARRCAGWPTRHRSSGRARATPRAPG